MLNRTKCKMQSASKKIRLDRVLTEFYICLVSCLKSICYIKYLLPLLNLNSIFATA